MPYEGYVEYLCENGHKYNHDIFGDEHLWTPLYIFCCPECGQPPVYFHHVDVTNGSDPDQPGTYPAETRVIGVETVTISRELFEPAYESAWKRIL